ncbi:MAG: gamma-glutamyltransferase, partial [Betaproteobacteria bacterium]|nr:gamma-glutamyltransferase [Betaproteobacteria bacterium]
LIGGTPGGDQQTQWSAQVITGVVDHGLSLQQAVDSPRWYSFPGTDPVNIDRPAVVRLENGVPEASIQTLAGYGHVIERLGALAGGGAVQLIQLDRESGVLRGASDPRPGGSALGF